MDTFPRTPFYPNSRIRLSVCPCVCVTKRPHLMHYPRAYTLSNDRIVAWVTRPERPKGAMDEVKQAQRAAS